VGWNSGEFFDDTLRSAEELVNMRLGRTVLPTEFENKLLQLSKRKPYSFKETSSKKAIWNKVQKSSNTHEVSVQKSSSGSEMEIEFLNDDSDDNINDGGAVLIFTGLFLIDKGDDKWAQCVGCNR
jgi:hypothetical protein